MFEQVNSRGHREYINGRPVQEYKKTRGAEISPKMVNAVEKITELLRPGQWIHCDQLGKLCRKYGVNMKMLLYQIPVAISENSLYYCLPNDNTPDEPGYSEETIRKRRLKEKREEKIKVLKKK